VVSLRIRHEQLIRLDFHQLDCSLVGRSHVLYECPLSYRFICLLAFILVIVGYKRAREKPGFKGFPRSLLEKLSAIRLATFIESPPQKTKGRYKATYCLEEMDNDLYALAEGMGLIKEKMKFNIPFSVYN